MKKVFLIFIFLLAIRSFSQNISLDEKEMTTLLCKTWKLNYGETNGQKISGLDILDDVYQFSADKTYTFGSVKSSFVKGFWKYNVEMKRVELYAEDHTLNAWIKSIDLNEFILLPSEKSVRENFNLEFHFEPGL